MPCCGPHKTTTQTIGYAPFLYCYLFPYKYFGRKLSNDGVRGFRYGREFEMFECKDIIQFA